MTTAIPAATNSSPDPRRFSASSLLFGPDGTLLADYQKLHLFDVKVPDTTGSYQESATTLPGDKLTRSVQGSLKLGMTICYDVRFPGLMQALADAGTTPGWISAAVDLAECQQLASKMPIKQHNRFNSELKR